MEQLLDQVPLCHPLGLRTTLSMAFVWALSAMPCMAPAFLAPDYDEDEAHNLTTSFITVQKEFSLTPRFIDPGELTSSIYFLGNFFLGQIPCVCADRIGRRPVLIASVFLNGISGVLAAAAPTFSLLLFARFIQGANFSVLTMVNWVLCTESISFKSHATAAIIFGSLWVVGYCAVAPLAYYTSSWRELQFLVSAPCLIFAVYLMFTLPESASFLASMGKTAELRSWISMANSYKQNKVYIAGDVDAAVAECQSPESTMTLWECIRDILKSKKILIYLAVQIFIWIVDFMMYAGMALTPKGLGITDPYWSFTISGLVELPCYFIIPYFLEWIGRKASVILVHLLSAFAFGGLFLCTLWWPDSCLWVPLWMLGKFGMASAFMCCFVYGAEIFPVENRNICLGLCATLANLGAVVAPHLDILDEYVTGGCNIMFVIVSLVAAAITTLLPETKR